jgi:hypothetical protein
VRALRTAAIAGALLAAALAPAAGDARPRAETWKPKKAAKRACGARKRHQRRRACSRWVGAGAPRPGHGAPGDGGSPGEGALPKPLSRSVQVKAREYSLTLSRTLVGAGEVMVEFNTVLAEDPHDLWLRDSRGGERRLFGETAPELVPPPRQAFPIAAGGYVLFCALPGHEALGMRAPLAVQ